MNQRKRFKNIVHKSGSQEESFRILKSDFPEVLVNRTKTSAGKYDKKTFYRENECLYVIRQPAKVNKQMLVKIGNSNGCYS